MNEVPVPPASPADAARPRFLTVLCVLTFAWSGLNLASSLAIGAFFDPFIAFATRIGEQYKLPGVGMITSSSPAFFFVSALFFAGALAGALLMWRLRKAGFHLYTISQILLIIAPMYFYRIPGPSMFDLLSAGIFVLLYSAFLKKMS